jgi:hypothetical protein
MVWTVEKQEVREVERRVRLPRVREYQREVLESGARFKHVMCGRRWGKTTLGVIAACAGHGPTAGGGTGSGEGQGGERRWRQWRGDVARGADWVGGAE